MENVRKGDIVTAFAVGSSRVSACIAILDNEDRPRIIGLGKSDGKFMGKRGLLEIDVLSKAMRYSLKAAQDEAGIRSDRALVSVSGGNISSEKSKGMIKLGQRSAEISDRNVRDTLKVAETVSLGLEKEIIHSIPQDFIVDSQNGINNPVGLYGVKLEVDSLLITAHFPFLQNITKCLNLAGVELDDVVFSGIAASQCLFPTQDTDEKGIILLEIDNNFTAISIFSNNILRDVHILQKSVIADGVLEVLKEKADKMRGEKPISKILLAGGAYIHEDFIEKVDSEFGIPSQMAYARNIKGSASDINNPAYITPIGLALYGFQKRKKSLARRGAGRGLLSRLKRRTSDFIDEYF